MDFHDGILKSMPSPEDCFEGFNYCDGLCALSAGGSLVLKKDSVYADGGCRSYSDALSVLRWNCGYPLCSEKSFHDDRMLAKINDNVRTEILEAIEISIKYAGYIEREQRIAEKIMRLENLLIPEGFDFDKVESLSIECRQKLKRYAPKTIAQASRISGVSPADISVLLVYFGR